MLDIYLQYETGRCFLVSSFLYFGFLSFQFVDSILLFFIHKRQHMLPVFRVFIYTIQHRAVNESKIMSYAINFIEKFILLEKSFRSHSALIIILSNPEGQTIILYHFNTNMNNFCTGLGQ